MVSFGQGISQQHNSQKNMSTAKLALATVLCVILFIAHPTLQQLCASTFVSETQSTLAIYTCPVGYINTGTQCQKYADVFTSSGVGASCSLLTPCKFKWLTCSNSKCVPNNRLEGDSCDVSASCQPSAFNKYEKVNCYNKKCQRYSHSYTRKLGESCNIPDEGTNTVTDCAEGTCLGLVCVKTATAGKGETCGLSSVLYPTFTSCNADNLYCKITTLATTGTCTERKLYQQGEDCTNMVLPDTCATTDMTCRYKSATATVKTCERPSVYGEYCRNVADCSFTTSGLVLCKNNKCIRMYAGANDAACTENTDCYSGYCNTATSKCAEITGNSCSVTNACSGLASCTCGGKSSGTQNGQCVNSCIGPYLDAQSCLYNMGVDPVTTLLLAPGLGYGQMVDESASTFTSCRTYFSKYYSCIKKAWTTAGVSSSGSLTGVNTDASTSSSDVVYPARNNAHVMTGSAVLMIISFILSVLMM